MSAGKNHTCLLHRDGTVTAFGFNESDECTIPAPGPDCRHWYTQVSAGFNHTVLLRNDCSAIAVGSNMYGQCDIPADDSKYMQVAAGTYCTVLLRLDGQPVFVGDLCDSVILPSHKTYTQVSASFEMLCTVSLLCTDGTAVLLQPPQPLARTINLYEISRVADITQVCAGGGHANDGLSYSAVLVHLRRDGTAFACGCNRYNQCDIPMLEDEDVDYTQVSTSGHHTVLLRSDGTAVACGFNGYGQCNIPELEEGQWYEAAFCGGRHTVLLRSDGEAVAFGDNGYGQCRIPVLSSPLLPGYYVMQGHRREIIYLDAASGPHSWILPRLEGDDAAQQRAATAIPVSDGSGNPSH